MTFPPRAPYGIEEEAAACNVLRSGMLSAFRGAAGEHFNGGHYVHSFEDDWRARFGYRHVVTVNSWTTGLVACLKAVGIGPGDEVIVPAYTMSATAAAVTLCGAEPVYADIEPDTFCIDPMSVVSVMTPKAKAIVAVHLFGQPADMDRLRELASQSGLALLEDCAQAPGVRHHGSHVGSLGDIGGFSLTQTKHIHTGEGGVIVTDDEALAEYCRRYRNHGENAGGGSQVIGGNYRLTELQAAIGSAQLPKLAGILEHRQRLAARLTEAIRDLPGITPPIIREGCEHAWFTYSIRYDQRTTGLPRRAYVETVNDALGDRVLVSGYVRPLHQHPVIGTPGVTLTVVQRMHDRELIRCRMVREPCTEEHMDRIAEAMAGACKGVGV